MSEFHACCRACDWPTAKSLIDANGLCLQCLRTVRKNGVRDDILKKVLRVYAHCV
jgi:hypothetical protein